MIPDRKTALVDRVLVKSCDRNPDHIQIRVTEKKISEYKWFNLLLISALAILYVHFHIYKNNQPSVIGFW